jgi:hypothetical protein
MNQASTKQLNMVKALAWKLRPYYLYARWHEIRAGLLQLLRNPTMQGCHRLIKRMVSVLSEKQTQKAPKYWLPMDYHLDNPGFQKNLLRMASSLYPDQADVFEKISPRDISAWRRLKNFVERRELLHSRMVVPDRFDNDIQWAELEADRWQQDKRKYEESIEGVEYLEPTPGIDSVENDDETSHYVDRSAR